MCQVGRDTPCDPDLLLGKATGFAWTRQHDFAIELLFGNQIDDEFMMDFLGLEKVVIVFCRLKGVVTNGFFKAVEPVSVA